MTTLKIPVMEKGLGKNLVPLTVTQIITLQIFQVHYCTLTKARSNIHLEITFPTSFYSHSIEWSLSLKRFIQEI